MTIRNSRCTSGVKRSEAKGHWVYVKSGRECAKVGAVTTLLQLVLPQQTTGDVVTVRFTPQLLLAQTCCIAPRVLMTGGM